MEGMNKKDQSTNTAMDCDNDKIDKMSTIDTMFQNPTFNPMGDLLPSPPWMDHEMGSGFANRHRGFSNDSRIRGFSNQSTDSMSGAPRATSRSFNFQQVTPLNIPGGNGNGNGITNSKCCNVVHSTMNPELPLSAYDPCSLETVSSIDTAGFESLDKGQFVRTAPSYRDEYSSWDQAIASLKTPNSTDTRFLDQSTSTSTSKSKSTTNGNVHHHHSTNSNVPSNAMPHFMQSQFFNSSLPMMDYSGYSSLPTVPQSAPPLFNTAACNPMFGGIGEDVLFGNGTSLFGDSMTMPLSASDQTISVCESDIFGSGVDVSSSTTTRDRNWSHLTTESENEPIINLVQLTMTTSDPPTKRRKKRGKSMSFGDLPRPQQMARSHVNKNLNLPPKVDQRRGMTKRPMGKKRGRPPKSAGIAQGKYAGMKKAEREKLRRRELKEGYETLTRMLGLCVEKSGAALPDRAQIVAAACEEIKRLENLQNRQNK